MKKSLILIAFLLTSPLFASDKVQGFPSWWDAQFTHDNGSTKVHAGFSFVLGGLSQAIWNTTGKEAGKGHNVFLTGLVGSIPMGLKDISDCIIGWEGSGGKTYRDSFLHSGLDYVFLDYASALLGACLTDAISGLFHQKTKAEYMKEIKERDKAILKDFDEFSMIVGPYSKVTWKF